MTAVNNAIYDEVADTWWDHDGFMAILRTGLTPPRAEYIRRMTTALGQPLHGAQVVDIGCGGGLLAEVCAAAGAQVTGIDLSSASLAAARHHAAAGRLQIDYRLAPAEAVPLPTGSIDVAICCDVLEHVTSPSRVIAEVARLLRPGGVFVYDTIDRTWRSWLLTIFLAQEFAPTRIMPRHTHVWRNYIRPAELTEWLLAHGLQPQHMQGLRPATPPWSMAWALWQLRTRRMSFARFGERLNFALAQADGVSYIGCARRG